MHTSTFLRISLLLLYLFQNSISYFINSHQKCTLVYKLQLYSATGENRNSESNRGKRRKSRTKSDPVSTAPIQSQSPNTFGPSGNQVIAQVDPLPFPAISQDYKSKLSPITGSVDDVQQRYNKKSAIERYIEDLTKPTPVGEEPKSVQLIKAITWFGVIALVLVEIFVSIKTGGSPAMSGMLNPDGTSIPTDAVIPPPSLQDLSYPGESSVTTMP